jgi:hypothetical protein
LDIWSQIDKPRSYTEQLLWKRVSASYMLNP